MTCWVDPDFILVLSMMVKTGMMLVLGMLSAFMWFSMFWWFQSLFNTWIEHKILDINQLCPSAEGGFFNVYLLICLDQPWHREKCINIQHIIEESPFSVIVDSFSIINVRVNGFMDLSLKLLILLVWIDGCWATLYSKSYN